MPQLQNPREEAFVRGRLTGLNKSRAAVLAGFSPRSAMQIGSQISRRPHVKRRMEELRGIVLRVFEAIDGPSESERVEREFGLCAHKLHGSRCSKSEKKELNHANPNQSS
jgi:terminase small subunit-like protein